VLLSGEGKGGEKKKGRRERRGKGNKERRGEPPSLPQ